MIHIENLVKAYGPVVAVDGISFDVRKGEVVGFLGPNGAGKTTTMKVLTGFLAPTAGLVEVAGMNIEEQSLAVRRLIGYLPESNPLYEDLEVVEYLTFLSRLRRIPAADIRPRIKRVVDVCGLGAVIGKDIGALSKGFKQRLGFAQSIIHDPQILVLDEPTSGLDPNQAQDIRSLIRELRREKTVLLSTHILSEVEVNCDSVLIINRGKIAASGTPDELRGMVSGQATVRVTYKEGGPGIDGLQSLPGVARASEASSGEPGCRAYEINPESGADPREAIFRQAAERGWVMLELQRQSVNLETIFQRLTDHD